MCFGIFFQNRMELPCKNFVGTGIAHFREIAPPQAGGPINLNFLGHYDYWARWKALVTENSKMSSSGSFSLMPQRYQMSKASNLPFYFQKRQNRRIFVPFLYFLVTLVVALEKMTLRMTFLNSL